MNQETLLTKLATLPLGKIRYLDSVGSTNDLALKWAAESAPDLSLILADEQTSGRGRSGRQWYTPKNSALAFSLILRPAEEEITPSLFIGLGALALAETIQQNYNIPAKIKWPNDVLIDNQKVAGILLESVWLGNRIETIVLGMGVNVLATAVPTAPVLDFPATSIEHILGQPINRIELLHAILSRLITWLSQMNTPKFISAWESMLAYKSQTVQIIGNTDAPQHGQLRGLNPDGSLKLILPDGNFSTVHFGDVHLRPIEL